MMKPLTLATLLALSACATVPPPVDTLAAAESTLKRAAENRIDSINTNELKSARQQLELARSAVAQRENLLATRLAEQARLDAELAYAKGTAFKAQFDVDAMKKGNEALRQNALRSAVNVAPIAIPLSPTTNTVDGAY